MPIFDKHYDDILRLEAIRNLLLHKAGIMDAKFIKKLAGLPEHSSLVAEKPIFLTGESIGKLTNSAVGFGVDLFNMIECN